MCAHMDFLIVLFLCHHYASGFQLVWSQTKNGWQVCSDTVADNRGKLC